MARVCCLAGLDRAGRSMLESVLTHIGTTRTPIVATLGVR
jgi:hypothetical protein